MPPEQQSEVEEHGWPALQQLFWPVQPPTVWGGEGGGGGGLGQMTWLSQHSMQSGS